MNYEEAAALASEFAQRVTKGEAEESREDCATYAQAGFMQGWATAKRAYERKAELLTRINQEIMELKS